MVVIRKKVIWYYKQQRRFFLQKFLFSVLQNKIGDKFSLKLYVSFLMLPHLPLKCERTLLASGLLFRFLPPVNTVRVVFLGFSNMCIHLEW